MAVGLGLLPLRLCLALASFERVERVARLADHVERAALGRIEPTYHAFALDQVEAHLRILAQEPRALDAQAGEIVARLAQGGVELRLLAARLGDGVLDLLEGLQAADHVATID